jgi:hypothetical protein
MATFHSFVAFCKDNSINKVQVAPFTNSQTGEEFKSLVLSTIQGDKVLKRILVRFGKSIGALSPQEISRRARDLKIAEYDGKFALCNGDTWETVELDFLEE